MNLQTQCTSETYYDILNVKDDASYEEIRQSYRSALLQSHPDKLHKSFDMPNSGKDRFTKVQEAWETLCDSRLRALYDNKLRSSRVDIIVADDVALEDMMVEDTGQAIEFYYQCRCGDYFSVSCLEMEEMGYHLCRDVDEISFRTPEALPGSVILPCGSCSLKIRLLISVNTCASIDGTTVKL